MDLRRLAAKVCGMSKTGGNHRAEQASKRDKERARAERRELKALRREARRQAAALPYGVPGSL